MSTTAIDTVRSFCEAMSKGGESARAAIRRWFTPETVCEQAGLITTTGIEEALALLEGFEQEVGIARVEIEILAIAADGDRVLTERLDRIFGQDGQEIATPRVMGIFEVDGHHITAWRDYFDMTDAIALKK